MRGLSRPPSAPRKSGPRGSRLPRAEPEIRGDRRDDGGEHRDDALLAALAGDAERVAGASRRLAAGEAERLGDAEAAAIEEREDRRVPRRDPRLLVERLADVGDLQRRLGGERPRQRPLLARRPDGAEGGAVGVALALEPADQRADAGDAAGDGARPGAVLPARGEEGADVGDAERGDIGDARRPAEMQGEEDEELLDVAGIGLDRLRRQPPLMGEVTPPALDRLEEVGPGEDKRRLRWCGFGHGSPFALIHARGG